MEACSSGPAGPAFKLSYRRALALLGHAAQAVMVAALTRLAPTSGGRIPRDLIIWPDRLQVAAEPARCQRRHLSQGARFLKQMGGSRNHDQFLGARQVCEGPSVEAQHRGVRTPYDEKGGRSHH